ncbi:protein TIC 22-like, chloroplastic isoform X2 [Quercus robur]|uniref:protein TIC 22-like, chloroplastic isoform X2 n=1 Tax=Quercus robur TaxID=38942 RepID=UPI002161E440|nr:protein TIC 22-like, chloroplastic isoform X2 [Quercus robur]
MKSHNSNTPKNFPSLKLPPQLNPQLQEAFCNLQNHCSNLLQHLPNPSSLKTHFQSALSNLQNHAIHTLDPSSSSSSSSNKNPVWARIAKPNNSQFTAVRQSGSVGGLSTEAIEERLAGVPVYALSNASEEFVLVSGVSTKYKKSLGLFCFKKEDAEALLEQIKSLDPNMQTGSKVVAVALNKVVQLKLDGVAFRLIPESSQVKNALREMEKIGISDDGFSGVPVFQQELEVNGDWRERPPEEEEEGTLPSQMATLGSATGKWTSRSLILKSQNKSYRPAFFRKEDLENSLLRASRQQNQINPAFRRGDIQFLRRYSRG